MFLVLQYNIYGTHPMHSNNEMSSSQIEILICLQDDKYVTLTGVSPVYIAQCSVRVVPG